MVRQRLVESHGAAPRDRKLAPVNDRGLNDAMQRAAGRAERVDAAGDLGILFEHGRMMRLDPRIDDESRQLCAEAAHHLAASGQRAALRGDSLAAAKLLRSAYELMPGDDPGRARLVAEYGLALDHTGDLRDAHELLGHR